MAFAFAQPALAADDGTATQAAQPPGPFYIRLGPGGLLFDASAVIKAGGAVVPDASVTIDPNITMVTEIGYRWRNFGVSFTGGLPPSATVNGAGSLSPFGALGRIRYGPTVLTLHYHAHFGRFEPYVGGGPVRLLIFRDHDGAVRQLHVAQSWGAAGQIGVDYRLTRRWSLYLDAKKALLQTRATALLGGAPITAKIRLDPLVLSSGLALHF